MRRLWVALLAVTGWAADAWLTKVAPAMLPAERKAYLALSSVEERQNFQRLFWTGKAVTEPEFLSRLGYIDSHYGSGQTGSGANTDQGRMYLALGAPTAVHRTPSSRIFYETEIWFYDYAPQTGYRSRLQFLFFRPRNIGDFKLYSPMINTIRALLVPQSGTRSMFGINDVITPQDVRTRMNVSPAEDEVLEAALGVAKGITGVGNSEILSRAMSPAEMLRRDPKAVVKSTFSVAEQPDVRIIQFWVDSTIPVTDVQLRTRAVSSLGVTIERRSQAVDRSEIPLGYKEPRPVLFTQRFFLPPGSYSLIVEVDGRRMTMPFRVADDPTHAMTGEAFEERPGETKISLTPDPRGEMAKEALARLKGN
ncbi:MAG: GWxTD domain-containing protein [Acidobacteria bacterium]|nr:GWxTD domain-containing protein [Acidobacteriota bacterium]